MQIITGNTEKKQIMEQVIQCHLGVDGDPPDRHRIASHHWLLALLQWQLKMKNLPLDGSIDKTRGHSAGNVL